MLPEHLKATLGAVKSLLEELDDLGHLACPRPAGEETAGRAVAGGLRPGAMAPSAPAGRATPSRPDRAPDLEELPPPLEILPAVAPAAPRVSTPLVGLVSPASVVVPTDLPGDLDALGRLIAACGRCPLAAGRKCAVPGEGPVGATILFVGEAPGAEEDRTGRPFVGEAGKLLDRIIKAMGDKAPHLNLSRETAFITNAVKCRPPHNDTPLPDQLAACRPYLEAQIAIVRPRFLVALGGTAALALTGKAEAVNKQRGRLFRWGDIPLAVTYHPAALLRNEVLKKFVWQDMQWVLASLGGEPGVTVKEEP